MGRREVGWRLFLPAKGAAQIRGLGVGKERGDGGEEETTTWCSLLPKRVPSSLRAQPDPFSCGRLFLRNLPTNVRLPRRAGVPISQPILSGGSTLPPAQFALPVQSPLELSGRTVARTRTGQGSSWKSSVSVEKSVRSLEKETRPCAVTSHLSQT